MAYIGNTLEHLRGEAEREAPREAVAAWFRRGDQTEYSVLANLHRGLGAFEIDSLKLLAMEEAGWRLAAFGHSHPDGAVLPSSTDVEQLRRLDTHVRAFIWARSDVYGGWLLIEYDREGESRLVLPQEVTLE